MYDGQRGNYSLPGDSKNFCAQDVAAVTGVTVTSINQAAAKMARAGILVIDGKVWRTFV